MKSSNSPRSRLTAILRRIAREKPSEAILAASLRFVASVATAHASADVTDERTPHPRRCSHDADTDDDQCAVTQDDLQLVSHSVSPSHNARGSLLAGL